MPKRKSQTAATEEASNVRKNPSRKVKERPKYFEEFEEFSEEEGGYEDENNTSSSEEERKKKRRMRKKGGKKPEEKEQVTEPLSQEEEKDKKLESQEPKLEEPKSNSLCQVEATVKEAEEVAKPSGDMGDQPATAAPKEQPNLKVQLEQLPSEQKNLVTQPSTQDPEKNLEPQNSSLASNLVPQQEGSQ